MQRSLNARGFTREQAEFQANAMRKRIENQSEALQKALDSFDEAQRRNWQPMRMFSKPDYVCKRNCRSPPILVFMLVFETGNLLSASTRPVIVSSAPRRKARLSARAEQAQRRILLQRAQDKCRPKFLPRLGSSGKMSRRQNRARRRAGPGKKHVERIDRLEKLFRFKIDAFIQK